MSVEEVLARRSNQDLVYSKEVLEKARKLKVHLKEKCLYKEPVKSRNCVNAVAMRLVATVVQNYNSRGYSFVREIHRWATLWYCRPYNLQ